MSDARAQVSTVAATRDKDVLPLSICLAWGAGTIAVAALFNSVNVLLLRYAVDYAGVGAALVGTLIAMFKIYDAFIDPFIGAMSDRTRSRSGRRRPFLLGGGILLAIAALFLFNLPAGGGAFTVAILSVSLLIYATGYAAFSVPYMAMPAEMTESYHERSRLIAFRVAAVAIASMLAVFIGPLLIDSAGGGRAGHTALSVFLAIVILSATAYCFIGTRGAAFHFSESIPATWHERIRSLAGNRPFVVLIGVKLLQLMALAVTQAAMPFLFQRILKLDDSSLGLYFLFFYATMILVQPLWIKATKSRGKRDIYLMATLLYGLIYVSWYFVTEAEPLILVYARAIALGALGGAVLLLGQSLLPDTMEWDFLRTGMRREGMLSAVYTVVEKIAFALGVALTGIILGRTGYIEGGGGLLEQPASAIQAIYWLSSFLPFALLVVSALGLLLYNLDETKLALNKPD